MGQFQHVGQVGNLPPIANRRKLQRVNNPLQDDILPHILKLTTAMRSGITGSI